jgi:hypothetical protein
LANLRYKLPHGDDSLTAKSPAKGTRRAVESRKLIGIGLSHVTTDRDRDLSLVPNSTLAIMHHYIMHILEFVQFLFF